MFREGCKDKVCGDRRGLVPGIIDLDPVAVGVFEVDLFYPVGPVGNLVFITGPVLIFNVMGVQHFYEVGHGRYCEAKVAVFVVRGGLCGAGDEVQVAFGAYAEPGMFAIVKGFGYGVETDDGMVEGGAGFQVYHVLGDMVKCGPGWLCRRSGMKHNENAEQQWYFDTPLHFL